jgi:hypothetical protein
MYRLMRSEKFTLNHLTAGLISFYRQTQVKHFRQFRAALGACERLPTTMAGPATTFSTSAGKNTTAVPGSTDLALAKC